MENKSRKELLMFGFGISFVPSFIIYLKTIDIETSIFIVLIVVGLFVYMLNNLEKRIFKFCINFLITCIFLLIFKEAAPYSEHQSFEWNFGIIKTLILAFSFCCYVLAVINPELLRPISNKVTKIVHFAGGLIYNILLMLTFYIAFAPAGIILRILGKDLLNRKIESNKNSYWTKREEKEFLKEKYLKQF